MHIFIANVHENFGLSNRGGGEIGRTSLQYMISEYMSESLVTETARKVF